MALTARDYEKLGHFIVSAPIISLSTRLPHPSVLTLVFNSLISNFLRILIISHFHFFSSSVSLTSSSSPSSLTSYLNCSSHRRTHRGRTPCRLYRQHQFYCKERIWKENREKQKERDLCSSFSVLSQQASLISTATAARKYKLLNASQFGGLHSKNVTLSTHEKRQELRGRRHLATLW